MQLLRSKDFLAGLTFLAFGLGFAYFAQNYRIGSARAMGPGYLPALLGWVLAALGAGIAVADIFKRSEPVSRIGLRGLFFITLSAAVFAICVRGLGLFFTIILVSVLTSFASPKPKLVTALVVGIGSATVASVVFVRLLDLYLPIFGPWLGF